MASDPTSSAPIVLDLPFHGRWQARNSPARRVPSHGTHRFGVTYAIDFVSVDEHARSAPRSWRSCRWSNPRSSSVSARPSLLRRPALVAFTHDGEPDHEARRSQPALLAYALSQARRVRAGAPAIAGNHVVLSLGPRGPYVLLAHLRRGSVRAAVGQAVTVGTPIGQCGNSGNSTEPHVHVQVSDSMSWSTAKGLPIMFRRPSGSGVWLPAESEIVDAW